MTFIPADKIILALDGMDKSSSMSLIAALPKLTWVKVGLELFVKEGPSFVDELRKQGKKVFLDLKFHDIPTTMSKSCRQAAISGAGLITVHACAGRRALEESNKAAIESALDLGLPVPKLLAVTVLTSWTSSDFAKELFFPISIIAISN